MNDIICPCGSAKKYADCCQPFHQQKKTPLSAEQLMRSRYSAFAIPNPEYLWETTFPPSRKDHDLEEILNWANRTSWTKLEILKSSKTRVEFKAFYTDENGNENIHHELSVFKYLNHRWYYVSGVFID